MFGVTGGATGSTEKHIFTFTKSGAVPIGTACIENGIFKLNKSLTKKTYSNSNKNAKIAHPSQSRKTNTKTSLQTLPPTEDTLLCSTSDTHIEFQTPVTETLSINIATPTVPVLKTTDVQQQSDPTTTKPVFQEFHDDGYHSANSPSSNGEEDMELDIFDLDKDKTENMLETTSNITQYTNEPIEYVQEFLVNNIIDTDGLDFQLITEDANENTGYTSDDSSDSWEDLSSKLIDADRDPTWHPQDFELKKVAVFDNRDLHQALFPERENILLKKKQPIGSKKQHKHKKGPKPLPLEKIDDEDKKKNIIRCREYRCKKNESVLEEMTELEQLEERNKELKLQEQAVKDKVKKFKDTYIKLISEGRIIFC